MATKLFFKDQRGKFRVVEIEQWFGFSLDDQRKLKTFITAETYLKPSGAVLSIVK